MSELFRLPQQWTGPDVERIPNPLLVPSADQIRNLVEGPIRYVGTEEDDLDESARPVGEPLGEPATEAELIAYFRQKNPQYDEGSWEDHSACRGTDEEAFYPEGHRFGALQKLAKRVCEHCPVRVECLQDALNRQDFYGIRGATRPSERRRLSKMKDSGPDTVS